MWAIRGRVTLPTCVCTTRRQLSTTIPPPSLRQSPLPVAQALLQTLEKAPCLQCGMQSPPARAACPMSGMPLTCSIECAQLLLQKDQDVLKKLRTIAEDFEYAATSDAQQLFSDVLQLNRRRKFIGKFQGVANWEDYLRLYTTDERWISDPRALRLVSATYSYVMTLAMFLPDLQEPDRTLSTSDNAESKPMLLYVLGARAEAMMPHHLWEDLSLMHPARTFDIKLVGDHVPIVRHKSTRKKQEALSAINLENIHGLYHELLLQNHAIGAIPDAFVLFNPGIGHPFLKDRWIPTIKAILSSSRPVLVTSFSQTDQERDIVALRKLCTDEEIVFRVPPQQNRFQSLKFQIDSLNLMSPIQTNSYVMVFQGKGNNNHGYPV